MVKVLRQAARVCGLAGAVVVALCVAGCEGNGARGGGDQIENGACRAGFPGLVDLDGRAVELCARGSAATVVVFARTDCPISNRYAPEVKRLWEVYHGRGVEMYMVYVDPAEGAETIRSHLREYGYPCAGVRDTEHSLVKACGATVTPEAAVFDRRGVVKYVGRIDDLYEDFGKARRAATTHELADAIEAVVTGKSVAVERVKAVGCLIVDVEGK